MNTVAWLLILGALLLIRQVFKGRVMNLGEDLSDSFLAILQGDADGLTEVLSRTGEATTVSEAPPASTGMGVAPSVDGNYKLNGVKPVAKAAADHFGVKYGIKDIGGVGKGSVRDSDHPNGLALDFMTKDKAKGDALAADLVANAKTWHVKYVIWYKRINTLDGRGWRPYSGPSNHTDHVHASFFNAPIMPAREPRI